MSGNGREARAAPTRRRFLVASAAAAAGFLTRPAPLAAAATLGVSPVASYPLSFRFAPAVAQESVRLSQERKEFGIAVVLEQILAEQDLTRARNDYVTAVADYDKAQYALLRATGARPESGQERR